MDLLRIFLYLILLITALMALSAIIAFIDGSIWSERAKLLRSIAGVVVILSPVTVFYTLFVDGHALVWVGVSFILFFSLGLVIAFTEMRGAGIGWAHIRSLVGVIKWRLENAGRIVPMSDQRALPTDEQLRERQFASSLGPELKPKSPEDSLGHDLRTLGALTIVPLLLFSAIYVGFKYASLAYVPAKIQPLAQLPAFVIAFVAESLAYRAIAKRSRFRSAAALSKASYVTALVTVGCSGFVFVPCFFVEFSFFNGVNRDAVSFAGGLAALSCFLGQTLLKVHTTESMSQAMSRDTRPPVLYLRPFSRESFVAALWNKARDMWQLFSICGRIARAYFKFHGDALDSEMEEISKLMGGKDIYGRLTFRNMVQSFASGRGSFYDEQLVLTNIFRQIGPYVAISRPGETNKWSDVGAAKQTFSSDKWQEAATHLILDSAIIVFEAGNSTSLLWELEQIVRLAPPVKVLLVLPKSEQKYANFRDRTQNIFPKALPNLKPSSRLVCFDQSWSPCVLQRKLDSLEDPMNELSCAPVLLPFLEQNGYMLAEHSETLPKITRDETLCT